MECYSTETHIVCVLGWLKISLVLKSGTLPGCFHLVACTMFFYGRMVLRREGDAVHKSKPSGKREFAAFQTALLAAVRLDRNGIKSDQIESDWTGMECA